MSQTRPDELYLQKPVTSKYAYDDDESDVDTPTVGPLRIQKGSPRSRSSSTDANVNGPPYPVFSSAKPNPPYPDTRHSPRPVHAGAGAERTSRTSTPESQAKAQTGRRRFSANDPNRPTLSGYSRTPPAGLRPGAPPQPKPLPESPGPEVPDKDEDLYQAPSSRPAVPAGEVGALSQSTYQQYYPPPDQHLGTPDQSGVNRLNSTASTSTTAAQRGSPPPPETPIVGRPGPFAAQFVPQQGLSLAAAQRSDQRRVSSPQQAVQESRRPWTPTEQPGSYPHGPPAVYQGNEEVLTPKAYQRPALPVQSEQQPYGAYQVPQSTTQPVQAAAQPVQFQQPSVTAYQVPQSVAQAQEPAMQADSYNQQPANRFSFMPQSTAIEQDLSRVTLGEDAPPPYASVSQAGQRHGYPNEKRSSVGSAQGIQAGAAPSSQDPNIRRHPAFANEQPKATPSPSHPAAQNLAPVQIIPASTPSPAPTAGPVSPPPLPEGWIAHLDPNSGQYYYIHLPTQSTQWEFPKGPLPLKMQEPLSPTATYATPLASPAYGAFSAQPMASPGFSARTPWDQQSAVGLGSISSPTVSGFTGPPPSAGVEMYRVQPTNGVYFGPYLRYTNMDLERGLWLGSILIITDVPQPPTIHIHQSTDLSPNPRQLKANAIYTHQRWIFYRYDVDLLMEEQGTKWTYAITSHLGCTRYEFLVAGRYETSWRFIAHSGNDFSLNVNANERSRLGGVGLMWKDVLQKHVECGGFHAQLGLGGQIVGDRLWKEIGPLRQWTAMSGKENRKNAPWTAHYEDDVTHAYFHYYTSHFDQPHLREAFAQIPHVLTLDDRDIFDGYGSYPDYMQQSNMFKNIGRIGIDMYLLFQHHTTHEILRAVNNDLDLFTITGQGWHFVKYLGPAVVVVGPDTRSERDSHHVMAGPTYQGLFPKIAVLPPSVQHCIWTFPVPLIYPRLETAEHIAHAVGTGKKAVTGTFNMLGRVTSSVAGVVGAKGVVGDGFSSIKKAVGKSGLMSGILSPFGEIDMLDELRDMWTHESKDLERTYIFRTLQGIAHNKSLRMTFLSGSVSACGAGLVHDPARPSDHKTMYQLIASPIVDAPVPGYVLRLLNQSPKHQIYIPPNGHRSASLVKSDGRVEPTDTKEDMMEIFGVDVNGAQKTEGKRLMGRRNYLALVAYDPEAVQGAFAPASAVAATAAGDSPSSNASAGGRASSGRLSLAADFMVQGEGAYGAPVKYGPVIVPSLEFGR